MMRTILRHTFHKMQWGLLPLLGLLLTQQAWSQCNNGSPFGTVTAPTNNSPLTITTCAFGGEYSTINSCSAGSTYQFSASGGAGNYITIRQGTPGGTVLGFGFSPITVVCTVSGPLYLHYNTNAACGTDGSCHTGVVQCMSCPGAADPCTSITTISGCGISQTPTLSGSGQWSSLFCGFSTPGMEKIYSFTPTTTGTYLLNVTSTSATTYIDYAWKAASGGCNSTGWTCIDDVFSPSSIPFGPLTAGVTYYILLDPESATSVTHTFNIGCPAGFDPCASIPTVLCGTAVTSTPSGAGVWNPLTCGFSTPGQERVYVFTPTTTGAYSLQVNSVAGGYIDYFWKAASGGCNATGWTCIDDINFTGTFPIGTLTAGVPYYILLDPEATGSYTHNWQIVCASAAPPCVLNPTSPANGSNVCPNTTVTLSWPASPGATSYDVYFGTTATPGFVGNTAATSFSAGLQTTGTRFWQIRPVGPGGTATGCTIWSFNLVDATPPTITCPASVMANNSPATACSAVVVYGSISATDACGAPSIVLQSGQASNTAFPVGVNVVVYRATDPSGNTATCSFTVTVKDVTLPTITCPANIVGNNDPGVCGAVRTYSTPAASDNCGIQSVTLLSGLPSGSTFPVGTTTNVWRATDVNANTQTCSFTVKINDIEPPVVTCPPPVNKPNDAGQCSRFISNLGNATVADNCIPVSLVNSSPGTFPVGTTTVIYTLTDNSGNTGTCAQTVTVYDQEYPSVICPPTIEVETDEFDCIATVDYAPAAYYDNCPGVWLHPSIDPLSSFDIGYTAVTYTVMDMSGNTSECTFLVHVKARAELCNDYDDDCDGYTDEAEEWTKVAKRIAKGGGAFDEYGIDVDIDGDWAVVGSNKKNTAGESIGTAYILRRSFTTPDKWIGVTSILPSQVLPGDGFGISVAVDSNLIAVGAPYDDETGADAGAVYVYQQSEGNQNIWVLVKKILGYGAGDHFGAALDLDNETLLVGAPLQDGNEADQGAAHGFQRNQGGTDNWGPLVAYSAPDGQADDHFGTSVSRDGNWAIVGAPGDDDQGAEAGAAYILQGMTVAKKLHGTQVLAGDQFGASVAISGAHAVVGAPYNDLHGTDAGAAMSFYQNAGGPNNWGQWALFSNNFSLQGDHFGAGVALAGDYAVITAPNDDPFGESSGMGFVYLRVNQGWSPLTTISSGGGDLPTEAANFGRSVAMNGRTIAVGSYHDQLNNDLNRGSAYFFEGVCAEVAQRDQATDESTTIAAGLNVQCRPVPFTDVLTIEVNTEATDVRVTILNTLGQEVTSLNAGAVPGRFEWQSGAAKPGLYFVQVRAGGLTETKTVVLARP